jgi:hypothetical protein
MHTDGNAIGGLLQEIFLTEVTAAPRICQSCGRRNAIGAHRLYRGAGLVLRCPSCGDLAGCIVVLPDRYLVSLSGAWSVARPVTAASATPPRTAGT